MEPREDAAPDLVKEPLAYAEETGRWSARRAEAHHSPGPAFGKSLDAKDAQPTGPLTLRVCERAVRCFEQRESNRRAS